MSRTNAPSDGEEYGTAEVNDRGRLTIPKALRNALQIEGGTEFTVVREGSDIRLVRQLPDLYSDALENRATVTLPALGLLAVGFSVLALWPSLRSALVGVALIGVGVGGTNPPLLAYLGDISPEDDVGKLGGVYNVFGDVGSTLGPLVALPVAYAVGFAVEYLLCAVLVVLAAVLVGRTLFTTSEPSTTPAD